MKKITFLFSVLFIFFSVINGTSQSIIWEEAFPYDDGAIEGSGTPPKWTIDVSDCNISDDNDYFEVRSDRIEGRDLDGEAILITDEIDISTSSNISLSVELSSINMESSDYLRVYYKLDGGAEELFAINGNNTGNFTGVLAGQTVLTGSTVQIVCRVQNNGGGERHYIDNIIVSEPVAGDVCSDAIAISEVTDYTFSTINATVSGQIPDCGGSAPVDLWFAYSPTISGIASVNLCGSDYNTRLAVWDECTGAVIACNDDDDYCGFGSTLSYISGNVTVGTTYYIQVGGFNEETGTGFLSISVAIPPANDDCENAIPVNEVTDLPFSTLNATTSGITPSCGGSDPLDIWFSYTPAQSGIANFDLCGSEFDTRLALWDGCDGTELICNDNDWGFCGWFTNTSFLSSAVSAETTYYIQVSGNGSDVGEGDLTITLTPYPENDECLDAILIDQVTDLPFTTIGATAGGNNPGCGGDANPVDIWYKYAAPVEGMISVDLCGSQFDTRLALWNGCNGEIILCNDNDWGYCGLFTNTSHISGPVAGETTYYIQVGGNEDVVGSGDLTLTFYPFPTNDECADAIVIGEVTDLPFSTEGATAGGNNPSCGGTPPIDIWYAYTPAQSGEVDIDLCGSNFDTRLAIWDGCNGIELMCNDNDTYCGWFSNTSFLTGSVTAYDTYYIQVGGSDSNTGVGDITIALYPYPTNDECADAIAIGEVTDLTFTTVGASAGGNNPECGGSDPIDIWYIYTPSTTGNASFDLCGSSYNTRLAIWDECDGNVLMCNDDDNYCGFISQTSYFQYEVLANETYYVQIGGSETETGNGDLTISLDVPESIWTGALSSDWDIPGNWYNNISPGSLNDVVIPTGALNWPIKTGDLIIGTDCNEITMGNDSELSVLGSLEINNPLTCVSTSTINISENWTFTDSFNPGSGTVNFNGSEESTIENSNTSFGGGKIDWSGGGGQYYAPAYNIFDCYEPFNLISVYLYAGADGTRTFYWATSDGTVQEEITVYIPWGLHRVTLNFNITPGISHRLGATGEPIIYRNNAGVSYPYPIGSVGSITDSYFGPDYYYFFYDLEYSTGSLVETFHNLNISKNNNLLTTASNVDVLNNLTVADESYLTNGIGFNLNVAGNALFESSSSGTASFIDNGSLNVEGTTNVEQYLTPDSWHYVSSPVANALSGTFTGIYLKPYVESIDDWGEYIISTTEPLNIMQGYSAWVYGSPATVSFEGSLNNGDYSIGVTCRDYDPLTEDGGWNLVGNPYPSPIDWDAAGWVKDQVDNTIYFYSGIAGSGNYLYYQGSGGELPGIGTPTMSSIIPANQSFFVHVTDDGVPGIVNGTLGVSNDVRVHNNQAYYKDSEISDVPVIRLVASNQGDLTDEAIIRFYEGSTLNHDGQFDAYKLFGWEYPQLYTLTAENEKLAINTLPGYKNGTTIPLHLEVPDNGKHTISLTEFTNFMDGTDLFIEDLFLDIMYKLSDKMAYSFASNEGDDPNRFILHLYTNLSLSANDIEKSVTINTYENSVFIQLPEEVENANVVVYNLMGQKVTEQKITGNDIKQIQIDGHNGYYLVTVQMGSHFEAKKIFIW